MVSSKKRDKNKSASSHGNKVFAVLWRDASWVSTKKPPGPPAPQLTVGFLIEAGKDFANIGMNVRYHSKTKSLWPVDGFIIPRGAIIRVKALGSLEDEKK